jgi:apolipoprotein N-acyltransferase
LGASTGKLYQRVPVPIGMWRPFSDVSVPLRLNSSGIIEVDHQRAALLICYEEMLTFPVLASMLHHPTAIIGISNSFWFDETAIPLYQAAALRAWARLFRLPLFTAVNS